MKTCTGVVLAALSLGATVLATTVPAAPAAAEVIQVPVGQQAAEKRVLEVPTRGITKAEVERRFGAPLAQQPTVGSPPISSWDYENYRVYFERDLVLHTVLKGTAMPAPLN
ncbi:MAG: hypothetical protein IPN63_09195 [Gammaproteobacteria bacterium]|nr:hypothetical protein [Gammaproteobacteria bacterium]